MPKIQFDVLVPTAQATRVEEIFQTAVNKLVNSGSIQSGSVGRDENPALPEGMEDQLRQTYRDEHEDRDLEDASVQRYVVEVEQPTGSVNQLAMVLSRLLTPHAVLPKDHVLLEDEVAHERPAIFPWALNIIP